MDDLRLSDYVHVFEVEPGATGVYSPFGHEVAFLATPLASALRSGRDCRLPPQARDDLIRRGFLVAPGSAEKIVRAWPPPPPQLTELWLVVTRHCNLACRYCVVEGNQRPASSEEPDANERAGHMSIATAEAAIAKFFEHARFPFSSPPRIIFYGGEPLLNQDVLRTLIPQIRRAETQVAWGVSPQILVITNGQIYSNDLTALFSQYRVSVSVSLDGEKRHHDAARRTGSGSPTFDRACESLHRYMRAGLNTGICTTIGAHNVADLPDIADYFGSEFGVPVQFQVPYDYALRGGNPLYVSMRDAAGKLAEAFARLRRRGILEGLTMRRASLFLAGGFNHRDCGAVSGQLVVAPDGRIGPCHSLVGDPRFFGGHIQQYDGRPTPLFEEWWNRIPVNMIGCCGCAAIALCGGGCPYNALVRTGSIWGKDPQQCEYMFALLEWLVSDLWQYNRDRLVGGMEAHAHAEGAG